MAIRGGPKTEFEFNPLPNPGELTGANWCARVAKAPYSWQSPIVDELVDDNRPRIAYVQVPRKNGKSKLAADVVLNEMCNKVGRQTFLIADSERNLKSALFFELCQQIRESPVLSGAIHIYKDHLECPFTDGAVWLRANNLSASQSINPDLVVFDEVHMQRTDQVWNGMVLAGAAAPHFLLLGITTPGYDTESLARHLYQQAKDGEIWGRIHEASGGYDLKDLQERKKALYEANPVLRERPDMMSVFHHEFGQMPEHDFRRFRLGQWTETATAWLPFGAWDECASGERIPHGSRVWLGFDGSYAGDSTGLVAVDGDGRCTVLGLWEAPEGRAKESWRVPRHEVDAAVRKAFKDYRVELLAADPPYWQKEIQDWTESFPRRVVEFSTASAARMAPACTDFYSAVMEGRVKDCTEDPELRKSLARHLSNATPKPTPHGSVIVKHSQANKIDLAVALVVAHSYARKDRGPRRVMVL